MQNRSGFAMPMVILVIGFLTAGVLAAFARTGSEFQLVDNHRLQTDAFAVAEAGLQEFIATGRVNVTTRTYSYSNGTAVVTATQMRPVVGAADAIWLIQSVGSVPAGNGPPATRTVAQFATLPRSGMKVTSALTSYSGVDKSGSSGSFNGSDACGVEATLPGSQIPSGGFWDGQSDMATGNPPIDSTKTQAQLIAESPIDWASITNAASPAITPDIVICGTGSTGAYGACGSWPSFADTSYFPVILIDGNTDIRKQDLVPNGLGRGTVIATGNVTFGGNASWEGIMLVGGILRDNGSGGSLGATVAGLNLLTGGSVGGFTADMNGTKNYRFDSCNVAQASSNFVRLAPITNAWVDNWTSW